MPIEKFTQCKSKTGKLYKLHTCNSCRKEREFELNPARKTRSEDLKRLKEWRNKNRGTIDGFIYGNLHKWRGRSSIPSDLTFQYLKDLWVEQEGKCFYTKIALNSFKLGAGRKNLTKSNCDRGSPSLDKLDPDKGYIQGNVVWCSHSVNSMKGNLTKEEFYEVCLNIVKFINN